MSEHVPPVEPGVRVRAIVAAHGDLAAGLLSAVRAVTGQEAIFRPLTNTGLDRVALETLLRAAVLESGARVVFTDLPGGSWTLAARRLQREFPDLMVVTGTSLPVLLDFVYSQADPASAARQAVERGRNALAGIEVPSTAPGA